MPGQPISKAARKPPVASSDKTRGLPADQPQLPAGAGRSAERLADPPMGVGVASPRNQLVCRVAGT